ncbi:lipolpqB domain protein [Mycobacterium xenopi 3993]|nr:lipolpqB domain protein [Mycobacterium xenopi 3993]
MRDAPVGGAADVGSGSCRMCVRAEFISAASHRHRRATGAVEPAQADPGMDPDVLLREFLKATADPANRHLAARQFLTQSASNAWDDAGSALLIDHVVFVETRTAERVSVTMRADILGSLSDMGVFETAEGVLPDPGPIELVKTSGAGASTGCRTGCFWTGSSSRRPTSATCCISPTRPARRWCPIRATSPSPIATSWPPSWSPN